MKVVYSLLFLLSTTMWALDSESAMRGKTIYDNVCFACHGKNLEGATGHNLKDSLWVHGASRKEIISSIKKGFPEKGMVAFGAMYKESQIEDIVNYILSRQEGLRDMEYRIYHNATVESGIKWNEQKPDKQANINPPHINLNLPEVDQFGIHYKGKLLIPKHMAGNFKLKGLVRQEDGFALLINSKKVNIKLLKNKRFEEKLNLKAGTHNIEFRYIKNFKTSTLHLELIGKGGNIPLSAESYQRSITNKHIVKAKEPFMIIRKRVTGLPPGAITVNHMNKINYAINPHSGAINAVWSGDSLDIGPNIYARGQKAAAFLGKQLMEKSKSIELLVDGSTKELAFVGYSDKPRPKFIYKYNNTDIYIESKFEANSLIINYSSPTAVKLSLKVPEGLNSKVVEAGNSLSLSIPLEVK